MLEEQRINVMRRPERVGELACSAPEASVTPEFPGFVEADPSMRLKFRPTHRNEPRHTARQPVLRTMNRLHLLDWR